MRGATLSAPRGCVERASRQPASLRRQWDPIVKADAAVHHHRRAGDAAGKALEEQPSAMLAMSCGRPRRPSGTLPANSNAPALQPPPGTAPGASALTPMLATQRASKLLHHHRLAGFGGRKVRNVARPRRMQRGDEEHATLGATNLGDRLHASPELACKTQPLPSQVASETASARVSLAPWCGPHRADSGAHGGRRRAPTGGARQTFPKASLCSSPQSAGTHSHVSASLLAESIDAYDLWAGARAGLGGFGRGELDGRLAGSTWRALDAFLRRPPGTA
jgi:hypothetical protein